MKNHVSRLAKIIYATKRTFETIQHVADIFFQPAKIASSGFWNEWTRAESLRRKSKNSIYIEYLTIVFRFLRPRLIAVHHCSICVEPIILHRDTEYSDLWERWKRPPKPLHLETYTLMNNNRNLELEARPVSNSYLVRNDRVRKS